MFSTDLILLPTLWLWGSLPGVKTWLAHKADNLTTIYKPTVYRASTIHNPIGLQTCYRESFIF
jgi:hypothetical protein